MKVIEKREAEKKGGRERYRGKGWGWKRIAVIYGSKNEH